jgi:hypothetical protein
MSLDSSFLTLSFPFEKLSGKFSKVLSLFPKLSKEERLLPRNVFEKQKLELIQTFLKPSRGGLEVERAPKFK